MTVNTLPKPLTQALPLLGRSLTELTAWVETQGQPRYRGKQLYEWLYIKGARNLADITVFPKSWREQFAANPTVEIGRSQIHLHKQSRDGTEKFLLQLADGEILETVGIPTSKRLTVCVSTQVGCPMACDFCATGKGGFRRNLAKHEIIDQVLTVQEVMQQRVSHIVFMGMGEPLLNFENLVGAIHVINQDIGIGQRNITVSTVGIPNQIPRFAKEHLQVTLAVSLHAPNQKIRAQVIPSADRYPLESLMDDCRAYVEITGRRISFEYTLL
ncbi:MAG: 23S rRNA (adenine(2503)-C(2))-methyltransferase RlmN, partial [Pseudanabaena sp.]